MQWLDQRSILCLILGAVAGWVLARRRRPNPQAGPPLDPLSGYVLKFRDFLIAPDGQLFGVWPTTTELSLDGFIYPDSTADDEDWVIVADPRSWDERGRAPRPEVYVPSGRPTREQKNTAMALAATLAEHGTKRQRLIAKELVRL